MAESKFSGLSCSTLLSSNTSNTDTVVPTALAVEPAGGDTRPGGMAVTSVAGNSKTGFTGTQTHIWPGQQPTTVEFSSNDIGQDDKGRAAAAGADILKQCGNRPVTTRHYGPKY